MMLDIDDERAPASQVHVPARTNPGRSRRLRTEGVNHMQDRLKRLSGAFGELVDQLVCGPDLGRARAHQEYLDEIASQPVPYSLTAAAEALLSSKATETAGP